MKIMIQSNKTIDCFWEQAPKNPGLNNQNPPGSILPGEGPDKK